MDWKVEIMNKEDEGKQRRKQKKELTEARTNMQERTTEIELVLSLVGLVCAQFQRIFPWPT